MGALARPHGAIQELKTKKQEAYPDGCSRLQEFIVAVLECIGFGAELGLDVQDRLVQRARPASPHPPSGRGAGRLGVRDRRARGAEAAFANRRHEGVRTPGVRLVTISSPAGGAGGSAGCLSRASSEGGGGGTITSGMTTSPPSLSMIGCSSPAPPVGATNSGGGGAEFRGTTNSGSWRRATSSSRFFAAASASASASFFSAAASALSASAFSRRAASCSSRASRAFRSCASRRSAVRSIRRVVVEVSADPMTEAAADFSRESGALSQEK